jgi:hypothetical protein
MFRSATHNHQEAHLFLIKITELKMCVFIRGDVVKRQHNMFCFYVVSGVVRCADSIKLIKIHGETVKLLKMVFIEGLGNFLRKKKCVVQVSPAAGARN